MELEQLSSDAQPLRTQRLPELCDRLAGRLAVCIRWQGRQGDAVGPERGQAPVHAGP